MKLFLKFIVPWFCLEAHWEAKPPAWLSVLVGVWGRPSSPTNLEVEAWGWGVAQQMSSTPFPAQKGDPGAKWTTGCVLAAHPREPRCACLWSAFTLHAGPLGLLTAPFCCLAFSVSLGQQNIFGPC